MTSTVRTRGTCPPGLDRGVSVLQLGFRGATAMNTHEISKLTRRDLMRTAAVLAGGAIGAQLAPEWLLAYQRGDTPAGGNPIDQMRAQMAMAPIETAELGSNLRMLSGPGGNVIVF